MEVDLETALDITGMGKYQIFHCALMVTVLGASVLEMIGCSFILPVAACDLDLSDSMRGVITSIPNIGVIITAPFWGRAADSFGRKPVLLFSSAVSGVIGLAAAFTPNLLTFALCKLAGSLFLSCPSSLGFAYAGELVPQKHRDLVIMICNAILMFFSSLCPIFAWGVLSYDWNRAFDIQPWRVLTLVYAAPLILVTLWLTQAKESPKFLMTKSKPEKALDILTHVYSVNTGFPKENYRVTSLLKTWPEKGEKAVEIGDGSFSKSRSNFALLRSPHLKWLTLIGFLMFGLFSLLNGLFLFAPNAINKVMMSPDEPITVCELLNQPENQTISSECVDIISYRTFQITIVASLSYGALVMLISLSPVSKKYLLIGMYAMVGAACLISATTTNRIVAGVSMSALQITALGIGPLTAYTVELFPTNLRGTAVGAVLMFGRVGSVVGANISGAFLAGACTATFYVFAGLLFFCVGLSFLLPKVRPVSNHR